MMTTATPIELAQQLTELFTIQGKQLENIKSDLVRMTHGFETAFGDLVEVQAQLESTEKSYDESLQENLKLQEQVAKFTRIRPQPGPSQGMDPKVTKAFIDSIKEFKLPPTLRGGDVQILESEAVPHTSLDLNEITVPVIPIDPVAEDVADELFAEARGKNRMGVLIIDEDVERLIDEDVEQHQLKAEAREMIPDLAQQSERALGDRAKMKDTLGRTQNACRRYKARIKRQKAQLAALQDLANAAFPLYSALVDALNVSAEYSAMQPLIFRNGAQGVSDLCDDFHNKFNNAAGELANGR